MSLKGLGVSGWLNRVLVFPQLSVKCLPAVIVLPAARPDDTLLCVFVATGALLSGCDCHRWCSQITFPSFRFFLGRFCIIPPKS